jgi:hypothetical protein
MRTFQINSLVKFLVSSTRLEHHVFIIENTSFHLLHCLQKCMKNIPYKTACRNGLPDDEHMMFQTRRRHPKNWIEI